MTDDRSDDVLKDLEAALAVTPSPEFAHGVRARIHRESSRRRVRPVWTMAGLAAAAAIVLAVLVWPRQEAGPAAVPATASRAAEPAMPSPQVSAPSHPAVSQVARAAAPRHSPRAPQPVVSAGPDLVVISNQRDVLQRLWLRASQTKDLKQEDASSPLAAPVGDTPIVSELLTAPVTITPLVVTPLGDRGETPVIRNREINAGRAR
ncbi:MAG TPA: hypothetical protein VJN96_24070 [Vicinamibacterales bacterium]|nr:hypothetical protein [Vicinamibacterales bacterium]